MRPSIPSLLAHIAAVIAAAPGCSKDPCGGSASFPAKTVAVAGDVACQIAKAGPVDLVTVNDGLGGICVAPTYHDPTLPMSAACTAACGDTSCTLPDDYVQAYLSVQVLPPDSILCSDGGGGGAPSLDAGSGVGEGGSPGCPSVAGTIEVTCSGQACMGRWTAGVETPGPADVLSPGEYFARCSYFEAASVHAFERLAEELAAHGAPVNLVRAARRAASDEVRHAETTRALARRFGVDPSWPTTAELPVRPLLEVACENAAEGCVRETYGAALGLVGAARAPNAEIREAMRTIAADECRHADLSWQVGAWAASRLDLREREAVRRAMQDAARMLLAGAAGDDVSEGRALTGMPSGAEARRIAHMLDEALFRAA